MSWWEIIGLVAIGFLIFKFVVKPLFKVVGFILLALVGWWLLGGF